MKFWVVALLFFGTVGLLIFVSCQSVNQPEPSTTTITSTTSTTTETATTSTSSTSNTTTITTPTTTASTSSTLPPPYNFHFTGTVSQGASSYWWFNIAVIEGNDWKNGKVLTGEAHLMFSTETRKASYSLSYYTTEVTAPYNIAAWAPDSGDIFNPSTWTTNDFYVRIIYTPTLKVNYEEHLMLEVGGTVEGK